MTTYEEIMGIRSDMSAAKALSRRLLNFRLWLSDDAHAKVHPAVCLVNGEATDGTRNAPVLVFEHSESVATGSSTSGAPDGGGALGYAAKKDLEGRVGMVDGDSSTALYDRTMGCQVRAVREIKKDEVMMVLPRAAMITPDLVASSDAGKAVFACCKAVDNCTYAWDSLENTTVCESAFMDKLVRNTGPQTLVKILHERKRAEVAFKKRAETSDCDLEARLAELGSVSTRAPFLAFLIHQRFSGAERPPVASSSFLDTSENLKNNALHSASVAIQLPPEAPDSFSPYARTLPSYVSIPLCWKRNELAMLAECIPGLSLLQDVGSSTLQLVAEFTALVDAGILERFPDIFSPDILTWDRWVWAAAVFSSRNLPSSSYFYAGVESALVFRPANRLEFQSPPYVWDEVGVLIPLLDMLNHEAEDHQVTWKQCDPPKEQLDDDELIGTSSDVADPRAIVHKKKKKGSEIYCCYGPKLNNSNLILQYGFAQMSNPSDEVRLGWSMADAVGNVDPPLDFKPIAPINEYDVFESNDEQAINAWWSDDRIQLLEKEAFSSDSNFISHLKSRKKMTAIAYCDGTYHPILLAAVVVATVPTKDLHSCLSSKDNHIHSIAISKRHQRIIQRYLQFSFTRKLEKLLQNLEKGLGGHFTNVKLWTKISDGGLNYPPSERDNGSDCLGWQSFFDLNAYKAAMEVENRYYAMGTASCILALYDGQLRALQVSLDGVIDDEKYSAGLLKQLEDLGFEVSHDDIESEAIPQANGERNGESPEGNCQIGSGNKSPRSRKRNKKKTNANSSTDRPPAVKLHVGNLSYTTTPADLYDYFSSIYGQDNVLECHIPIERETGRSRGFGFVAMPEEIAQRALQSGRKHEVDGRVLKIARSNSAGAVSSTKIPEGPPPVAGDRCVTCGYRPKYCVCPRPNIPGNTCVPAASISSAHVASTAGGRYGPAVENGREHQSYGSPEYNRDEDFRHRDYRDDRYRDYERDRRYRRDIDDYRRYDRDDGYYRERNHRDRDRDRSPHDRTHRSRSSSRRWERDDWDRKSSRRDVVADTDDYDRAKKRSHSRSRSKEKSGRRKKSKIRNRSRSTGGSASPT